MSAAIRHSRISALLDSAYSRVAAEPDSVAARFALAEALLLNGRNDDARAALAALEESGSDDVTILARAGAMYTQAMAHAEALRCCERALRLRPDDCTLLSNLAASQVACGALAGAESNLLRVIELAPQSGPAYYNLAVLKRRTPSDNHVAAIRAALARPHSQAADEVPLRYALAKELEDLGEYRESFEHLAAGAARRRASLSYRVEGDEAAMRAIAEVFDRALLSRVTSRRDTPASGVAAEEAVPLFVMGLPRSGTTLVDRILSSHSKVASLGEVTDFELALVRAAGEGDKSQLIGRSATLDFTALGSDYLRSIGTYRRNRAYLLDKTPRNYLYLGLVALSLPQAAVVYVNRDPMDNCYALFKTLFGAGSPYSYDLADLGRYYCAYHRLTKHWREVLPDRFFELSYEALVASQEQTSRTLLAACELPWEPGCLAFHVNATPAATASAAQVREPIHNRSVGLWKHYERELSPLARHLETAGLI